MNFDSLYIALPAKSPAEVQQWWNAFMKVNSNGDREGFFKWLFDQSYITELEYWDALDGAEMSLFTDVDADSQTPSVEETIASETPADEFDR